MNFFKNSRKKLFSKKTKDPASIEDLTKESSSLVRQAGFLQYEVFVRQEQLRDINHRLNALVDEVTKHAKEAAPMTPKVLVAPVSDEVAIKSEVSSNE